MIKFIATDMDGTLLNDKKEISKLSQKAIRCALDRGVLFAASSGRFYNSLNQAFLEYDENMILICHNGAWIQRANNGEVIYKSIITKDKIERIVKYVRQRDDRGIYLCQDSLAIVDAPERFNLGDFTTGLINYEIVEDILKLKCDICRIGIYAKERMPAEVVDETKKHFNDDFEITLGGYRWLDLMNKGISKGKGIETVQKMYGIKKEETMVFGDYYNDVEMFKQAYYSFAMEHSPEDVKKYANFVAQSNKCDGVAQEILKICG
jgi:Cof subfamily protein (haloacid dehalogenase superfamily)